MQIGKQQRLTLGAILGMFPLLGRLIAPSETPTGKNSNNSRGAFLRSRERVLWDSCKGAYRRSKHGPIGGHKLTRRQKRWVATGEY